MNKAMNFMCKLAYKLGELSTKTPNISTKPVKTIIKQFKQGREDSTMTDITI